MKTYSKNQRTIAGLVTFLIMSFLTLSAWSQSDEAVTVIRGKVIDQKTEKPLAFTSVLVLNSGVGTVSNNEGEFILKVPVSLKSHEIKFSFMGYKTVKYTLSTLKPDNNVIAMSLETINIKDVIVRANDPIDLISRALENIPENYGTNPSICTAFYRESIMQNRSYAGVAEAVLNIYKAPYSKQGPNDRIKVFKGRKSQDIKKMDTLIFKLQGGTNVAMLLDLAKNPETFLQQEYFSNFVYQPVSITNVEGRETYIIDFEQKRDIQEMMYDGRIYLDVNTLAFKKIEFSISPKGLPMADMYLVQKKPANVKVKPLGATYAVD